MGFASTVRCARRRLRPRRSRGAALLLVLSIIPALSLLGTTLLSQATLEGDRVLAQQEDVQAFFHAEAGLKRAAWVLETTNQLENAGQSLPAGVIASSATQGGVSSGAVDWHGGAVTLSATGQSGRSKRTLAAQFTPQPSGSGIDLKNVITAVGLVDIRSPNPPTVSSTVNGKVLSGDANTTLSGVLGTHPLTITTVPVLDVAAAIASVMATYAWTTVTSAQIDAANHCDPFHFTGGATTPGVYYSNDPGIYIPTTGNDPSCIQVEDECIWLIENGARFAKGFEIHGDDASDRLLVLITAEGGTGKGFYTSKSLDTSNLSLMVVTDGYFYFKKECTLVSTSLYTAQYVDAAKGQNYTYATASLDPWIDSLDERDLIPPIAGAPDTGTLTMSAGSLTQAFVP